MTSKQRAYLKSLAMKIDPIYNIGKGSISPELVQGVRDALEARELINVGVLQNCMVDPKELATVLAERTRSQVVQVIGKKIVLYKQAKDEKKRNKKDGRGGGRGDELHQPADPYPEVHGFHAVNIRLEANFGAYNLILTTPFCDTMTRKSPRS